MREKTWFHTVGSRPGGWAIRWSAAGRLGDPMECGRTVAFLASSQSASLSGVAVPIDGGESGSML